MSSEYPSRDKPRLVVPFRDADSLRRLQRSPSCDQDCFDLLASPLREEAAASDEQHRQRNVDNILALLKANAELRALAVKLSDVLVAKGGWDGHGRDKAAREAAAQSGTQRRG